MYYYENNEKCKIQVIIEINKLRHSFIPEQILRKLF